jgi:hypothetical protein
MKGIEVAPSQPRVAQWFPWLNSPAVRVGLRVGILLSVLLATWLFLSNRVPYLERFALVRNAVAMALFLLIAVIPVARFRTAPLELMVSGIIGWAVTCLLYFGFTVVFVRLSGRMGAFRVFVMGAAIYCLAAVMMWIGNLIQGARHEHLAVATFPRRRIH